MNAVKADPHQLMTKREVREFCRISSSALHAKRTRGEFPRPIQIGRRSVRYWRSEIVAGSKAGIEARDALNERLSQAKVIDLHEVERGKYFRLVAEVIADGENMSDLLLALGLAWPYDGGNGTERSVRGKWV